MRVRPIDATMNIQLLRRLLHPRHLMACVAISWAVGQAQASEPEFEAPAPGTYALPIIKPAADGPMVESTGKPVQLRELTRGRITVLSFIYTRCADMKACPMATGILNQIHRASSEDPALAAQLRLVSMSFDPENDTPDRLKAYASVASQRPTAAPWHFVTARSRDDLQSVLDAYGQAVDRKENPKDPTGPLNHLLRVFLVDAQGNIRNIYGSGTLDLRLVLADIRTLMLEREKTHPKNSAP